MLSMSKRLQALLPDGEMEAVQKPGNPFRTGPTLAD